MVLIDFGWYWVNIGWYWSVLRDNGSFLGGTGQYLLVLGQYWVELGQEMLPHLKMFHFLGEGVGVHHVSYFFLYLPLGLEVLMCSDVQITPEWHLCSPRSAHPQILKALNHDNEHLWYCSYKSTSVIMPSDSGYHYH